jgi:hypothetical protein
MASILILGDGMWAAGSYGSPLGSRSLAIRCALSSSIPPEDFHIIGLELAIHRHDSNPFNHGLTDDQSIERVFVVMREFGKTGRVSPHPPSPRVWGRGRIEETGF